MCNSGTEATMSAIRLARVLPGAIRSSSFEGCYHGTSIPCSSKPDPARSPLAIPTAPACRAAFTQDTVQLPFTTAGRAGGVRGECGADCRHHSSNRCRPTPAFICAAGLLEFLREITSASGALLIFDEVMTVFGSAWAARKGVLHRARPELFRENHRWRFAGRRVRRAGRKSWIASLRWGRCIKRGRSAETRSRWPRASPLSKN